MPEPLARILADEITAHLAPLMDECARLALRHGSGSKPVKDWLRREIARGLTGEDVRAALETQISWGKRIDSAQYEIIGTREIIDDRADD